MKTTESCSHVYARMKFKHFIMITPTRLLNSLSRLLKNCTVRWFSHHHSCQPADVNLAAFFQEFPKWSLSASMTSKCHSLLFTSFFPHQARVWFPIQLGSIRVPKYMACCKTHRDIPEMFLLLSAVPVWVLGARRAGWCPWSFPPTTWSVSASPWRRGWSVLSATRRSLLSSGRWHSVDRPVGRGRLWYYQHTT